MSASRTFTPLTGGGSGGAYQSGDKWGYQTAEHVREDLDIGAYLGGHLDLGGSDDVGVIQNSFGAVRGYREYTLNGDSLGGLTLEAVLFYRTSNAATSVQLRVRNTTTPATAGSGSVSTSTTTVKEVIPLTLVSGDANYRLEIEGGDSTNHVFGYGYLRLRKVPS